MAFSSSDLERLLSANPARLPLSRTGLQPAPDARSIELQDADRLFPEARNSRAALAGLLLRMGCWTESHTVSQDIQSPEGSYWHAIVHRMEPDSSNAGYWFHQTGKHAIFPELLRGAADILKSDSPKHWRLKNAWDPFLFIDWCDEAREKGGPAEVAAVEIQMVEWQLLFDWCLDSQSHRT